MFERRDEQLKVLYLFLSADGTKSSEEISMFGDICKKYGVEKDEKQDVIKFCNEKLNEYKSESNPVMAAITDVINTGHGIFTFMKGIKDSKGMQVSTLWNLMNLAYADKAFSEEEKNIINFLVKEWNISDKIFYHLSDSLETLNALYNYKKWINETVSDKEKRDEYLTEVKKDIDNILKSVEETVEEINVM